MNRLMRKLASERGAMRPIQYVLLLILIAIVYSIIIYTPSLMHQMGMSTIADDAAAKMNADTNDEHIRHSIVESAQQQDVHVGPQDIILERQKNPITNVVTIKWDEQVEHWWGKTQTLHKKVTAKAGFGELSGVAHK